MSARQSQAHDGAGNFSTLEGVEAYLQATRKSGNPVALLDAIQDALQAVRGIRQAGGQGPADELAFVRSILPGVPIFDCSEDDEVDAIEYAEAVLEGR